MFAPKYKGLDSEVFDVRFTGGPILFDSKSNTHRENTNNMQEPTVGLLCLGGDLIHRGSTYLT